MIHFDGDKIQVKGNRETVLKEIQSLKDFIRKYEGQFETVKIKDRFFQTCGIVSSEHRGHYCFVKLADGIEKTFRMQEDEIEEILLPHGQFFICTRGMIVNLHHVISIDEENHTIELSDGRIVLVSIKRFSELKRRIGTFCADLEIQKGEKQ